MWLIIGTVLFGSIVHFCFIFDIHLITVCSVLNRNMHGNICVELLPWNGIDIGTLLYSELDSTYVVFDCRTV